MLPPTSSTHVVSLVIPRLNLLSIAVACKSEAPTEPAAEFLQAKVLPL
jgi:hypothetical protein